MRLTPLFAHLVGVDRFLICWWYFDHAAGNEQRVRTHRDAIRLHVWSSARFPLSLGIVGVGVGVQRRVAAASHYTVSSHERAILAAAATALVIAMTTLSRTTDRRPELDVRHRPGSSREHMRVMLEPQRRQTDRDQEVLA